MGHSLCVNGVSNAKCKVYPVRNHGHEGRDRRKAIDTLLPFGHVVDIIVEVKSLDKTDGRIGCFNFLFSFCILNTALV